MNNIINFFVKHSMWFVLTFFVVISCVLLFRNNPYQQSVYLTSANSVTAKVYEGITAVTDYFNLKDINTDLERQNADLQLEIINLRQQLHDYKLLIPDSAAVALTPPQFQVVPAHVISNSVSQPYNYITINRGSSDGIEPNMGVVDRNGVVGVVNVVGEHAARIISLLNPLSRLSCKMKNTEFAGILVWDGADPRFATIQDFPKHGEYNAGDTVVTSGFTDTFPEGIMVGVIDGDSGAGEKFATVRVRLSANFSQLSDVRAFKNLLRPELQQLRESDENGEQKKEGKK